MRLTIKVVATVLLLTRTVFCGPLGALSGVTDACILYLIWTEGKNE